MNRSTLTGAAVEDLKTKPLPDGALEAAHQNRFRVDHVRNFFAAVRDKKEPLSDVFSHHRALSTCHLAGISARLNRKLTGNPQLELIVSDTQAQGLVPREYRKGFEISQG